MSKKKKRGIIIGSICTGLILLVLLCSQFVAADFSDIFSVVFDKAFVLGSDKIVVRDGDEVITITDKALVQEIAANFVVANRTGLCGYYDDKWMDIYNGDKLVRNIHWNAHDDLVEVYQADALHLVWPSSSKIGQIELSREFVTRLNEILESYKS